jgi:hypothetical protein
MVSRKWLLAAAVALWVLGRAALPAADPATLPGGPAIGWRAAPAHRLLFTPRHVPTGSYEAYTTATPLDEVLRAIRADPALASSPDAWAVSRVGPLDAFGTGTDYNRWEVARLYGGTPAQVVRGPRVEDGRVVEAWTLFSPFPDAALHALDPGTLLIILRLH